MKISEVIVQADKLRDNTMAEAQKVAFLRQLDGEIAEVMDMEETPDDAEAAETLLVWPFACTWPEEDAELLMPFPHDDVYVLYLVAMIDYYNQESALYANDMQVFNTAMNDARSWWRRHHRPPGDEYVKAW